LPTAEECSTKIDESLLGVDKWLHTAEVRRRVAVIMAEELVWRPGTGTGVVIRNDPRPDIEIYMRYPPNLGEEYNGVTPLLVARGIGGRATWSWEGPSLDQAAEGADLLRKFQALIPLAHRTVVRDPARCRIPADALPAALKIYHRVKATINVAVARAEEYRYLVQYVRERDGAEQFPQLQRVPHTMLPDGTASVAKPEGLQNKAQREYIKFVRKSFNTHAISPNVETPAVGVARGP
jgi:hypothetical protein